MALTAAERAYVLRFCGLGVLDYTTPAAAVLAALLDALTAEQEAVVRTVYLAPLRTLEAGYVGSLADADTKRAGPWERNPNALAEFGAGFDALRQRLAGFLGVPALGDAAPVVPFVAVV